MLVYFAHPIDQATLSERHSDAINDIQALMLRAGVSTYRPAGAFTVAGAPLSDLEIIDRINQCALPAADALVAWLPAGVPTLGVPAEIENALRWNKPTVILTDRALAIGSVQVANWRSRGAFVTVWGEEIQRQWRSRPVEFIDLLRSAPDSEVKLRGDTPITFVQEYSFSGTPPLLIKRGSAAKALTRAYAGDAGLDLAIAEDAVLRMGQYKMLRTGIWAAVPDGYWGFITGRSSAWSKYRLEVKTAVIDSGYRGELMVGVTNQNLSEVHLEAGTRLAQYVILPAFAGEVQEVDELPDHERGTNGYGSSGA